MSQQLRANNVSYASSGEVYDNIWQPTAPLTHLTSQHVTIAITACSGVSGPNAWNSFSSSDYVCHMMPRAAKNGRHWHNMNISDLIDWLIQPGSNWTHWATLRHHPCLSRAATSASSQVNPIFCRSLLTVLLQFALGRPGPLLYPGTCQYSACCGMCWWSIRKTCPRTSVGAIKIVHTE